MSGRGSYPRLPFLLRFYSRREWPRWYTVMHRLGAVGVEHEPLWRDAPTTFARGKLHGYTMELDLSHWSDRFAYFVGRFNDIATQLVLQAVVRPGDTFVDVGANTGMLSLLGARLVGPSGLVFAVDPNPHLAERIRSVANLNRIDHLRVIDAALSDAPATARFALCEADHTRGSLAASAAPGEENESIDVRVHTGDELLTDAPPGGMVFKIDVEGYECHVVKGLRRVIQERRPAIVTECLECTLRPAGSTPAELYGLLQGLGYKGFGIASRKRPFRASKLVLTPTPEPDARWDDVLWAPEDTDTLSRIEKYVVNALVA